MKPFLARSFRAIPAIAAVLIAGFGESARGDYAVSAADLETFLSLPADTLLGVGNGPVVNGSAIWTTFLVNAGDTLTFDYNFLTNEPQAGGGTINDFAFLSVGTSSGSDVSDFADVATGPSLTPSAPGFLFQTGLQTFSHSFTQQGFVVLGLGIVNVTDDQFDSALLIDHLTLSSSALTNGSFESGGFTGFAAIGDASVVGIYGTAPTDGNFQALLTTRSVPEPSSLALIGAGAILAGWRRRISRVRA